MTKHITNFTKIFGESPRSLEDILAETGGLVKMGTLSEDGNFEVWADGEKTERETPAWKAAEQRVLERQNKSSQE